jgi:hypothetical protein
MLDAIRSFDFRFVTGCVMIGSLVVVLLMAIYDLLPALSRASGDTISERTKAWWQARPIVPLLLGLAAGILAGHFGWPQGCQ